MEIFDAAIQKDESGRLTMIELPFQARAVFSKPKGTVFVCGTINGAEYRSRLLSRGGGKFVLVIDKALQKSIGYDGGVMTAHVTMASDDLSAPQEEDREPAALSCDLDVLTAIKTRQSIRKFTSEPVREELLNTILSAGLCAPSAKNKRPFHFVVIRDKGRLSELARNNPNAAMLESTPCAIAVCGDKNIEGTKEFLYADCAAAAQNILLCAHGLGLGGCWCGAAANSDWRRLLADRLSLPAKVEPVAVLAIGWPDEEKKPRARWEPKKIHDEQW